MKGINTIERITRLERHVPVQKQREIKADGELMALATIV